MVFVPHGFSDILVNEVTDVALVREVGGLGAHSGSVLVPREVDRSGLASVGGGDKEWGTTLGNFVGFVGTHGTQGAELIFIEGVMLEVTVGEFNSPGIELGKLVFIETTHEGAESAPVATRNIVDENATTFVVDDGPFCLDLRRKDENKKKKCQDEIGCSKRYSLCEVAHGRLVKEYGYQFMRFFLIKASPNRYQGRK